jgi:hypothetical protein
LCVCSLCAVATAPTIDPSVRGSQVSGGRRDRRRAGDDAGRGMRFTPGGASTRTFRPMATADTTDLNYWLHWRVGLCALWVLVCVSVAAYHIWRHEGPRATGSRPGCCTTTRRGGRASGTSTRRGCSRTGSSPSSSSSACSSSLSSPMAATYSTTTPSKSTTIPLSLFSLLLVTFFLPHYTWMLRMQVG